MSDTRTRTVIRATPRLGEEWARAGGRVSGLLLDLLEEPPDGPLRTVRPALMAWGRLVVALRAAQQRVPVPGSPCPGLCLVAVAPRDVDALGRVSRALGLGMLPGCAPATAAALDRAAAAQATTPDRLLMALARMHGVLDLDLGTDGELLYVLAGVRAGGRRDSEVRAATLRVTERVTSMWDAGADDD